MDLVAALLLIGLGQGLLLAGLLVVRRDLRRASTLFLATLIGAVTLSGLEDAALRFGWLDQAPAVAGAGLLLIPLIAVFRSVDAHQECAGLVPVSLRELSMVSSHY